MDPFALLRWVCTMSYLSHPVCLHRSCGSYVVSNGCDTRACLSGMQFWLNRPVRCLSAAAAADGRRRGNVASQLPVAPPMLDAAYVDVASDADALLRAPASDGRTRLCDAYAHLDVGTGASVAWAAHLPVCAAAAGGAVACRGVSWPGVHSVDPTRGPAGACALVVRGEGFVAAAAAAARVRCSRGLNGDARATRVAVLVGGVECTDARLLSDAAVTAVCPGGACGDVVLVRVSAVRRAAHFAGAALQVFDDWLRSDTSNLETTVVPHFLRDADGLIEAEVRD